MEDPTVERSFRGHKDVITGLSFKPSMTQLASSSMDYSVMVWNFKPQLRAFRFVGHKGVVTDVDFASTGNLLASSSRDKTVRLWTPNVKGDVTVFRAHTSSVRTVQFSADSENILTSSDDKTVKIWSTQKTKFQFTLAGHLNWVRTAKFSPDARLVVSGSDDKTVKLWDLRSKSCIKTYWDHVGMVTSVAFHPSGTIIASASTDKSIKLFDIRTHKLIQHYGDAHACENDGGAAQGGVNSIGFGGRSGEWLVSTGMDGLVKIWDLKEGHIFYTLHGHKNGPTTAATFSNDGQFFATGGSDSQIMVWKSNLENISKLSYSTAAYDDRATFHSSKSHAYGEPFLSNKSQQKSRSSSPVRIASAGGIVSKPDQSQGLMNESLDKSNPKEVTSLGPSIFAEHLSRNIDIDIAQTRERSLEPLSSSKSSTESSPKHHSPNQQQPQQASPHSMTSPLEIQDNHPEQLTRTIQQLVGHLDMLTQTMSILENRLSTNEDRVIDIAKRFESSLNRLEAKLDSKKASSSSPINRPASPSQIPIMKNRMANRNASPVPSNISNKSASQQQNSIFLDGFDEEQDTQL